MSILKENKGELEGAFFGGEKNMSNSVSGDVNNILNQDQSIDNRNEKINFLTNVLEQFLEELNEVLVKYENLYGGEFGYIDAAIMNLDYISIDELKLLNSGNIEASAIFLGFDANDFDKVNVFNSFINKLKSKDINIQTCFLGFLELINIFVFYKEIHQKTIDEDGYKNIIFNNPNISTNYLYLIEKIFKLIEENPNFMLSISKVIFETHPKEISKNDINKAKSIAKIFE